MSAVVSTGLVMGSVPTSIFFSIAAIALKESLIPAGLQFSAMSIESMSVLLAAVALNSLIFVRGIIQFPFLWLYPRQLAAVGLPLQSLKQCRPVQDAVILLDRFLPLRSRLLGKSHW